MVLRGSTELLRVEQRQGSSKLILIINCSGIYVFRLTQCIRRGAIYTGVNNWRAHANMRRAKFHHAAPTANSMNSEATVMWRKLFIFQRARDLYCSPIEWNVT